MRLYEVKSSELDFKNIHQDIPFHFKTVFILILAKDLLDTINFSIQFIFNYNKVQIIQSQNTKLTIQNLVSYCEL